MTLATRTDYKIASDLYYDEVRIRGRYAVEGTDKILVCLRWMTPEQAEDPSAVDMVLQMMDDEAGWAAAHPDASPVAHLVCD